MIPSWRPLLVAVLALVLLPAGAAAEAPAGPLAPADLEELEGLLRDLGFDPGTVDGVVDAETTEAIRRYQDFALLSGAPEPSALLLDELRGVAAAFAALNAGKREKAVAAVPDTAPEPLPAKVVVPPPPAPPKLTVPEEVPEEAAQETVEPPAQTAALPPPTAMPQPGVPAAAAAGGPGEEADPAAAQQALIAAELLRFLHRLNDGSLTHEDLARQFNSEGRALLQQAQYDEAIMKFSVAIHLDPAFAGAYANRGAAWRHRKESARAEADFDRARELGFGGLRKKGASNPLD